MPRDEPAATSHSRTVSSLDDVAKVRPLELKATLLSEPVCPRSVAVSFLSARFQRIQVLSLLAEARVRPSGLIATPLIASEWPWRTYRTTPVAGSQARIA